MATDLTRENEMVISKKIDDWKREKLEKEFKCLFYKTREITELLLESEKNTTSLQKEAEEKKLACDLMKQKYRSIKELLKESKQIISSKEQAVEFKSNKVIFHPSLYP